MAVRSKSLDLFPSRVPDESGDSLRSENSATLLSSVGSGIPPSTLQSAVPRAGELWFALHLPLLALEACEPAGNGSRHGHRRPVAVVGSSGPQQAVIACNAAATAMGIRAGMGVNAAYALASRLQVYERQVAAEQLLLERLAAWAGRFTPRVSLEPPDALLLEVKGSRKLFGGLAALGEQIGSGAREQGLTVWLALSPTPRAALWFARAGEGIRLSAVSGLPGVLARVPVPVARWPQPAVMLLASMGVHSLGECLRLPRDGFARRMGPGLLLELDQAVGRTPEVRRDFKPQVRFRTARDFEEEVWQGGRLMRHLDSLIDDLVEFLEARQAGVQAILLLLLHRDQAPTRQVIRFASLATQREHLVTVMTEQLSRLQLTAPVRGARLCSGPLLMNAAVSRRFHFAANTHEPRQVSRLLEKLAARLGTAALYSLEAIADHRPEYAWRRSSGLHSSGRVAEEKPVIGSRPAWLLTEPQPLAQTNGWPDYGERLELIRGPERIEAGWWSGKDVTRDYYVARTAAGLRLWIYRDRCAPHGWFLHGIFG
jgi:protein ImuB